MVFIYWQTKNGLNYPFLEVFDDLDIQISKSARMIANVYLFLNIESVEFSRNKKIA